MLFLGLMIITAGIVSAQQFPWQEPHMKVLPNGDLEYIAKPFVFEKGSNPRYIDFEGGSDSNDGKTPGTAWKHHPKDPNAGGTAKSDTGGDTFIFKRGVDYRGTLMLGTLEAPKSAPVRFTSDPGWGTGEAVICGSETVSGWKQGKTNDNIPSGNDIWYADLSFSPRNIWIIKDGEVIRIPQARTPNWKESDPEDVMSEWWVWENKGRGVHPFTNVIKKRYCGGQSSSLKGLKQNYVKGAYLWTEFGWVMSTPYPSRVVQYDPKKGMAYFGGVWGSGNGMVIARGCRFYLDDKPQYLDDPDGEFWFERKKDGSGRLHMIFPKGVRPDSVTVEAGKRIQFIKAARLQNVIFSGLSFKFNNVMWNLDHPGWNWNKDLNPACINLDGSGDGVTVKNCSFRYIHMAVNMHTGENPDTISNVLICDNDIAHLDYGAINVTNGHRALLEGRKGLASETAVHNVKILRNRLDRVGRRPSRYGQGPGIIANYSDLLEVAGNYLTNIYGLGMSFHGGKGGGLGKEAPLVRILVHHNKVIYPLMNTNDYGGIETWQGGPFYVFDNISGKTGGYQSFNKASFGHAYYQDGGDKNYIFNNIGWGRDAAKNPLHASCSASQSIFGYNNTYANNTFYRFTAGARRQSPKPGRNKYMGNIWQDFSRRVFRLANPAKTKADANAHDAGKQGTSFHHWTNALTRNIFFKVGQIGVFEESGRWHEGLEDFVKAVEEAGMITNDVGKMAERSPLKDPANLDFSPTEEARDYGVRFFCPWGLYANVAEWNFYKPAKGRTDVFDEHWFMDGTYLDRNGYPSRPTYPLELVNVDAGAFTKGILEDWVEGAMTLNGEDQYAVLGQDKMESYTFSTGRGKDKKTIEYKGEKFRNPQVHTTNFLIEAVFKTEPGETEGLIVGKMADTGYGLEVDKNGYACLIANEGNGEKKVVSKKKVNDGTWHHVVAEADRKAGTFTVYVDGKLSTSGAGVGTGTLANSSNLYVGGTPEGRNLKGSIDFLRICLGTLKDAKTTIEELYTWEFKGPQFRDFTGRARGKSFDAGAIELTE